MLSTNRLAILLIVIINLSWCDTITELILDEDYRNLTTKGCFIAERFRVRINESDPPAAIRVAISSEKSTVQNPLALTIIHGKSTHSISLPRIQSHDGKRFIYWYASDTLCDDDSSEEQLGMPVQLSILSSLASTFDLRVKSVKNFQIGKESFSVLASPPEPRYYMYTFPENVDKVDVTITSPSKLCGKVIARQTNCPLFDASGLLQLSGVYFYQSFTKFGGFSIRKSDIGPQFHLAFTVMSDDSVCGTQSNTSDHGGGVARIKNATITVTPVSETSIVSFIPIFVYLLVIFLVLLLIYSHSKWLDKQEKPNDETDPNREGDQLEIDAFVDRAELFEEPENVVSHREYQRNERVQDSKYFNFLFFQIFGSILPALTTLFQNQQQPSNKMNLDMCYLNYLCYSDLVYFNSLNGMASASCLAFVGILNLIVVFRKNIFNYGEQVTQNTDGIQESNAPKVVCLLGLVAMGFLWTITNNCPHKSTNHLYVYTSLWLFYSACMWIHSKRHGVRQWHQFFIIGVSSAFGCITLAENTFIMDIAAQNIINIIFFITAMLSTLYFCFNYYYERPSGIPEHQWISAQDYIPVAGGVVYKPLKSKIMFIIFSMLAAFICSLIKFVFPDVPVSSVSFWLGKSQVVIYLFFYIIQKIRFERSTFTKSYEMTAVFLTVLFFMGETANRILANWFKTFETLLTPAKSRELNTECILPGFDWNDLRQYNCAFDCFVFILLMDFIDSNLKRVPKNKIFVW